MATNRPFARNQGANIAGTEQIGNLAIGNPTVGFSETGLNWYGGPDEELGYVIAKDNPSGQSAADGSTAYLGFWRSASLTEASFIELGNQLLNSNYNTGDSLKTALNTAGYWTSWGLSGGNGGTFTLGDYTLSLNYAPAPQDGNITFPAHQIGGGGPGFAAIDPNLVGSNTETHSYQLFINSRDALGNDQSAILDQLIGNAGTLTLTQGSNSVTYTFTNQAFKTSYPDQVGQELVYLYDSQFPTEGTTSPLGSLTVTSEASGDFNTDDPITITITI